MCNGVSYFLQYTLNLLYILAQSGVGCHISGHFVRAQSFVDDITLVAPSRSSLPTLIIITLISSSRLVHYFAMFVNNCTGYDITFNGTKVSFCF